MDGHAAHRLQRIEALVEQARPGEAAALAAEAGLHVRAADLFEQACDFLRASDQARLAGDTRRALLLAVLSGDVSRIEEAQKAILTQPNLALAAAEELRARGHGAVSARLLELLGDHEGAARAYADAGLAIASAGAYEAIGQVREAARVLEAAHRAAPHDHAVSLRLARLLLNHRRFDAAVRLLQTIPPASPLRPQALPLLASCYEQLGLEAPAQQALQEAKSLGLEVEPPRQAEESTTVTHVIYGRYEILESVATTPSAQVYRAMDRISNLPVAVKQLRTHGFAGTGRDAFERLAREAKALAQLQHANVLPLVELIMDGGAIVTPWMSGGALSDLMQRERITPVRAVEIAASLLSALAEAHLLGILHRDIKPSNILFDAAGVARLADFGAAHVSDTSSTATAGVIGTLAYMSPEQRWGRPATPASDVYGVGATLLEMLTGEPPSLSGQPPCPPSRCHPDLGPAHDEVVFGMVAEIPEDRVSDSLEARKRLLSLRWPSENRGELLAPRTTESVREQGERIQDLGKGMALDSWLGRRILRIVDSLMMRRVAQAYASVNEPALGTVLRFDGERGEFWFEVPEGALLSTAGRSLATWEGDRLKAALAALHERGVAHGRVDAGHIVLRDGFPVLVFDPDGIADASPEQDMVELSRLLTDP